MALLRSKFTWFFILSFCFIQGLSSTGWALQPPDAPLTLEHQRLGALMASRSVTLSDITFQHGRVQCGQSIQVDQSHGEVSLMAGQTLGIENSQLNGTLQAGQAVELKYAQLTGQIQAGQQLSMTESTLHGDAIAGADVRLTHSRITGQLITGDRSLIVDDSEVAVIEVQGSPGPSVGAVAQQAVVVNGCIKNSVISSRGGAVFSSSQGGSSVSLGPGSMASTHGYTIRSGDNSTTVMLPHDAGIYVNGKRVQGQIPETYQDYCKLHPEAPTIQAPGWGNDLQLSSSSPEALIELLPGSKVGSIRFTHCRGKVMIHPGSQLTGSVVGGTIKRLVKRP